MFRYFSRRSPLQPHRGRFLRRISCLSILCLFALWTCIYFFYDGTLSSQIIVSLTSTDERFHYELPLTIHSLLSQSQLPQEIHIWVASTSNLTVARLKNQLTKFDTSSRIHRRFDRLVQIRYELEDIGPAMKYLPILREYHQINDRHAQLQLLFICDDDHYYHPNTIFVLNTYAERYPTSIVGLRGWRVRRDLRWGVAGLYEMAFHIVESQYIAEPYRVGIITANYGYLVRPAFFDPQIYLNFSEAPLEIRQVDDIWLNGHAAKRNIARYVVPSCCSHIGLTRVHALENRLQHYRLNRLQANDHALQWFGNDWERNLWYEFNGVNKPIYRHWWTWIYREAMILFYQFKFFLFFR